MKTITNIKLDCIDHADAPDYTDAFITSADCNGVAMTDEQLDELNEDSDFVYEAVMSYLH